MSISTEVATSAAIQTYPTPKERGGAVSNMSPRTPMPAHFTSPKAAEALTLVRALGQLARLEEEVLHVEGREGAVGPAAGARQRSPLAIILPAAGVQTAPLSEPPLRSTPPNLHEVASDKTIGLPPLCQVTSGFTYSVFDCGPERLPSTSGSLSVGRAIAARACR